MSAKLCIAATHSGAGKTLISMALMGAMKKRGLKVGGYKTGPDYIDPAFHAAAIMQPCYNFDMWAMSDQSIDRLIASMAQNDINLVEGVLGLFDGPIKGVGSTADVAKKLNAPTILIVDAGAMAQSVAALIYGFANFDKDVKIKGVIFNNIGSKRHEKMLKEALKKTGLAYIGSLPRSKEMVLPSRHLGLVQQTEMPNFDDFLQNAVQYVEQHLDIELLIEIAKEAPEASERMLQKKRQNRLGQKIAIAKDAAFNFIYPHLVEVWQEAGSEIEYFSPLKDEMPSSDCDAVYLPGGYPELFAKELAGATKLKARMQQLADQDCLIYGECGGYMILGKQLIDKQGQAHDMLGLLDLVTSFENPKRSLGYRKIKHQSELPFNTQINAHEFHYSFAVEEQGEPLFEAWDASGQKLKNMGLQKGRIMGSYAHMIDEVEGD